MDESGFVILGKRYAEGTRLEIHAVDNGTVMSTPDSPDDDKPFILQVVGYLKNIVKRGNQQYVKLTMEYNSDPFFFLMLDKITECHELTWRD